MEDSVRTTQQSLPFTESGRYDSGVAHSTGVLLEVQQMLRGSHGNVGVIPKEVAVLLEGKTFSSFNTFRSEFWKAVSQTKYAQEFGSMNIDRMVNGKSPIVSPGQELGKRVFYEIHHKTPIVQAGSVYDLSNILAVTPRYHQEVLSKGFHYGFKK
ncbi:MAG: Colicin-E7 [Holosporales bacterium]